MKKILALIGLVVIGGGVFWYINYQDQEASPLTQTSEVNEDNTQEDELDMSYFDEAEMVAFTKDYLAVLQRLYFVNLDNSSDDATTVSGLIMSMQTEAMQDRNELEKLLFTTEQMQQTQIAGARVTAMVLDTSIRQLIAAHEQYIAFLRGADEYSEIAEFQYQMSLFQSTTKSVYLSLGENTQLFPVTFFELNDDPDSAGGWRISEESKQEIVDEIELRFSDIFNEADQQYLETQTTDITVYIVGQLLEVFTGSDRF